MDEFFQRSRSKFKRRQTNDSAVESTKVVTDPTKTIDTHDKDVVGPDKRDLWEEALQRLSVQDQALLRPKSVSSDHVTVNDLISLIENKRKECDRRRWKFTIGGKQIILRDVAGKVITWLNKFKDVGDVAAGIDPVHAAPAWAGVRILLEVVTADSEQMANLLIGVEIVTYFVNRCKIYELLYLSSPDDGGDEKLTKALKNLVYAVSRVYTKILEFLAAALRHYNHSAGTRVFSAAFGSDTISSFAGECQSLETQIEADASNLHRIENRSVSQEVKESLFSLQQALASLDEPIVRTDHHVAELWDRSNQSRQSKILQWISEIPYEESHKSTKATRTPNTGVWLLEHSQYRRWRESSASTFLWLHGIPGAGKSTLVSSVVDDVIDALDEQPNDEALAFFYCNRNSVDRRQGISILRSFVRQLSVNRDGEALQTSIVRLYNAKEKMGFSSGQLDINECRTQLLTLTGVYPQTTLVLDALDECDEETQMLLIEVLDEIVEASSKMVKILIASRPNDNIMSRFSIGPNIGIRATDNQNDIATFVTASLEKDSKKRRMKLSKTTREKIIEILLEKSQGMFQWAVLQITQILKLKLESSILGRLGKLPDDLEKAYDEILKQVQSQPESGSIADRTLKWIVATEQQLKPDLIVGLVCQDPQVNALQEISADISFVLDACGNLVTYDSDLDRFRFAHLSVEEYLENHGYDFVSCHEFAARVCLQILTSDSLVLEEGLEKSSDIDETDVDSDTSDEPGMRRQRYRRSFISSTLLPDELSLDILVYMLDSWFKHVWYCETHGAHSELLELTILLTHFLGPLHESSTHYRRWHATSPSHFGGVGSVVDIRRSNISPAESAAWMMCNLGIYNLLRAEWDNAKIAISARNENGLTMLSLATLGDSIDICRKLLELGADVNGRCQMQSSSVDGLGNTALFMAVSEDRLDIVQLLLAHGADVNAQNTAFLTALQTASRDGNEMLVKLLLENGANVDMTTGRNGTALNQSVQAGSPSVVRLLVDGGADVDKTDRYSSTPLQTACTWMHRGDAPDMAGLLIDLGTDINAIHDKFGTALQLTVLRGHLGRARALLDRGADANLSGSRHASPLQRASGDGEVRFVETLLAHGADVNIIHGRLGTALQTAVYEGEGEIAELLLSHGAEVDMNCGKYGTAIQAAARQGDLDMVRLLLDHKASVNIRGGKYGTALAAAQKHRHSEVIHALSTAGAVDCSEEELAVVRTLKVSGVQKHSSNNGTSEDWFSVAGIPDYDTDDDTDEEEEMHLRVKNLQKSASNSGEGEVPSHRKVPSILPGILRRERTLLKGGEGEGS